MARKTKEDASRTRQQIIDAARLAFHEHGVSRTTLDQVAQAAGVTRGAVYWHFANKTDLFFAMKEQISLPLIDRYDAFLLSDDFDDPLDAIAHSLKDLIHALFERPEVRMTFEICFLRCEYVGDFAQVLAEMNKPVELFLVKLEQVYQKALEKGTLNPRLNPRAVALDTWTFTAGLLRHLLENHEGTHTREQTDAVIDAHIDLRRKG